MVWAMARPAHSMTLMVSAMPKRRLFIFSASFAQGSRNVGFTLESGVK